MTNLDIDLQWMLGVLESARYRIQYHKGCKKEAFLRELDQAIDLVKSQLSVKVTNGGTKQ